MPDDLFMFLVINFIIEVRRYRSTGIISLRKKHCPMFASKFLYKSFAWKTLSTEITLDKIFLGFGVYMLLSKSRQIFELAPKLCKMSSCGLWSLLGPLLKQTSKRDASNLKTRGVCAHENKNIHNFHTDLSTILRALIHPCCIFIFLLKILSWGWTSYKSQRSKPLLQLNFCRI